MKEMLVLMLGLIDGSTSFARYTTASTAPEILPKARQQTVQLYIQPVASRLTVNLLDAQGHMLYTVKTSLENGFQKQFNLSALEAGSYQLFIQTEGQLIHKLFSIKELSSQRQICFTGLILDQYNVDKSA